MRDKKNRLRGMETHRNQLGIKSPAPTGKKAQGKETHTREERVLGEATMTDPLGTFCIRSMVECEVMVAIDSGRPLLNGQAKHFRPEKPQIHFTGRRDAIDAPLGNGALGHIA